MTKEFERKLWDAGFLFNYEPLTYNRGRERIETDILTSLTSPSGMQVYEWNDKLYTDKFHTKEISFNDAIKVSSTQSRGIGSTSTSGTGK